MNKSKESFQRYTTKQHLLSDFSHFSCFPFIVRMFFQENIFSNLKEPIAKKKKSLPSKCIVNALRRSTVIILSMKYNHQTKQPKNMETHNTAQLSKSHTVLQLLYMFVHPMSIELEDRSSIFRYIQSLT